MVLSPVLRDIEKTQQCRGKKIKDGRGVRPMFLAKHDGIKEKNIKIEIMALHELMVNGMT